MFQLNKKKVIILLIIWILGLSTIYYFFGYKKEKIVAFEEPEEIKKDYPEVDYYSFYDENDLTIERKEYNSSSNYFVISGLKNKNIENKINNELYDFTKNLNTDNNGIYMQLGLNMANILSVHTWYYDGNFYTRKSLNYDLTTGNKIDFKSLFTSDANLSSILYRGVYDYLSTDVSFKLLSLNRELRSTEIFNSQGAIAQYYGGRTIEEIKQDIENNQQILDNIEDYTVKEARQLLDKEEINFYLTNYGIHIIYEDKIINLLTKYNSSYFAFYNKYKTENSIYENANIGKKNLFLSSHSNSMLVNSKIEFRDDYALIDFESDYELDNLDYVDTLVNSFTFDKNKFTYLNISGLYSTTIASIKYYEITSCIMDKEYFNNTYKYKLFDSKEYEGMGFINAYYNADNNIYFDCHTKTGIIDKNSIFYENINDLFTSDFDYESYLKNIFYNYLENNYYEPKTYTEEEKETIKLDYAFTSSGIIIKMQDDDNKRYYVDFNELPQEYLKIDLS